MLDYNDSRILQILGIGMRRFPCFLILSLTLMAAQAFSAEVRYQLSGRILQEDGRPFPAKKIDVTLHGAVMPYHAETLAGPDGRFKFKKLPAGIYTLIVSIPRVGEHRKTVEVGPSFADAKRVVENNLLFGRENILTDSHRVSAAELSVPQKAIKEFAQAQECTARQDNKGAAEHLKKAVEISKIVYSLHKRSESNRRFLVKKVTLFGGKVDSIHELEMILPHIFDFHREKKYIVNVDLYRILTGK